MSNLNYAEVVAGDLEYLRLKAAGLLPRVCPSGNGPDCVTCRSDALVAEKRNQRAQKKIEEEKPDWDFYWEVQRGQ